MSSKGPLTVKNFPKEFPANIPRILAGFIDLNYGTFLIAALIAEILTDRYYRGERFLTFCHPNFYVLPPLFQVFLEAESVVVAGPEVFPLVFAVADPSPDVLALAAEPEVVSVVAEPEVFALVLATAEPSPEVLVLVAEPEVFPLAFAAAEPSPEVLVFAFVVLVPVSVVVVEVDSFGRPKFLAFPNVDHSANSSSSVEVVGKESVHSSTDARTNYGFCSILSNLGLHQNKNLEHCYNNASPGYNNVSDTNALPINATTNHSRKTYLHLY
jgi:hypothetical protein